MSDENILVYTYDVEPVSDYIMLDSKRYDSNIRSDLYGYD